MIDDPVGTPDDDTTYIFRQDGASTTNTFSFTAFAIDSSAIAKVVITFRARFLTGGADEVGIAILRVNGTNYSGSAQTLAVTYADYTEEWLTNPDTGLAWVEADVEGTGANPIQSFVFRGSFLSAGEEIRLTQEYITVDYTEAAGEDPAADSVLFSQGQQQPRFDPPEVIGY